ncbi:histidine kinase [Erythrobacter jejuensis]|uniref:histidine kinase n=1 Tax=Parerythrobacter jejuensis TaxID=795812 RepID=A0A845AMP4_9SPHN|nr:histidine kinase [Parerythrobacter jejuensis]MXP33183.1 histidine kinase [Parerythrobacter jejuensis]
MPVAIFLLVAGIAALSVFAIETGEDGREAAEIEQTAQAIASALDRRGNTTGSSLRAGAALFATVEAVPAALFRRFVEELRLNDDNRGAEGIGWAESIAPWQIGDFEDRIEQQLLAPFTVTPQPDATQNRLAPVTFLYPDTIRARRALGYDMYSEPKRRAAMDTALQTNSPTASGKIVLAQEGGEEAPGFLVYMPVSTSSEDGRRLKGFLYSPFNAQSFLDSVIHSGLVGERAVRLYDGAISPENRLAAHQDANGIGAKTSTEVRVADRTMTVEVQSARGGTLSILSMLTLLFGLAVASLSMLVARLLTQQAMEDEVALAYFAEQNSIRDSLTRELNHRVKNTLANVLSIVSLTRRRAENLEDFATGLDGRIRALSATHDLLTQSEWDTTPIRDVITTELAPYAGEEEKALDIAGPNVELAPNDALSFGLAIHELATNASKYGALSTSGGKVSINWTKLGDKLARVEWVETGGPPVATDRKRGFGTELIEKIVAHELRSTVELDFAPEGVRCVLQVPIRKPSEFAIRARSNEN